MRELINPGMMRKVVVKHKGITSTYRNVRMIYRAGGRGVTIMRHGNTPAVHRFPFVSELTYIY